jgi:hypothetical protein
MFRLIRRLHSLEVPRFIWASGLGYVGLALTITFLQIGC